MKRVAVVGYPVRRSFLALNSLVAREKLCIEAEHKVILAFGGSGGARVINEAVIEALPAWRDAGGLTVLHVTGRYKGSDYDAIAETKAALAQMGISLLEQPLPAAEDDLLGEIEHSVPICADESCHTTIDLARMVGKYDAVNIKLDKTGGLTEALQLKKGARAAGLQVMVGCMLATSLAMAPALLLAQDADFVDLDGALLLARDRNPCLRFEDGLLHPPNAELWG